MTYHALKGFRTKHILVLILSLSATLSLVLPSEIAFAKDPPPEFGDDKLAPNDLKPNDLGKKSRDDYKRQHPAEEKNEPWIDKYYLDGEIDTMHDTQERGTTAEKAARYQRPTRGYKNKDSKQGPSEATDPDTGKAADPQKEVVDGGGIYKKAMPTKDQEIVENVWRFVEDLLWPKKAESEIARSFDEGGLPFDTLIFKRFVASPPKLDIGKRTEDNSYNCIFTAIILASLLRELGYKVQYKNTIPSYEKGKWGMQTAGINVWYNGQWHFYDSWESINKEDDYISGKGRHTYHDYKMYKATKPLTNFKENWAVGKGEDKPDWEGWKPHKENLGKDGAKAGSRGSSRMRIIDTYGQMTGWPDVDADSWDSSSPRLTEIPASGYFNPISLISTRTGEVEDNLTWSPLGEEILFWTFNNTDATTLTYTLEAINPTNVTTDYSIDLEINEVDRNITMTSPTTNVLNGTLDALEISNISLVFQVSAPRPTPPTPVQNLSILITSTISLAWDPSPGADYYEVYRLKTAEVPQNTSGAVLIGSHVTDTCFAETLPPDGIYFYAVTAVSDGGESELDPNEGSVEALQLPTGVGGIVVPVDMFGLLAPYLGLASTIIVATVATAVYVRRIKRKKEKQHEHNESYQSSVPLFPVQD